MQNLQRRLLATLDRHPALRLFLGKVARDNTGMLAGFVSWSILTALIPLTVGVVAIYSLFVESPAARADLIGALSRLFQGAVSRAEITRAVQVMTQNRGPLGVLGVLGVLWSASNIGGSFANVFQVIFETRTRPFLEEKLIDVFMIFVFTALMAIILFSSTATAFLDKLTSALPFPAPAQIVIVTGITFLSAFALFGAIYTIFPNIEAEYKRRYVWQGALLAAILFTLVSTVWPIYVRLSHASRFGAVLFSLIVLTAWIYAFSYILILGAEVISVSYERETSAAEQGAQETDPAAAG